MRASVLALVTAAATACAEPEDGSGATEAPEISGPLRLSSDSLEKSEAFTATFTDERAVPGDFSLAVWNGTGWTYQYQLFGADEPFGDGDQAWRTWSERTAYLPDPDVGRGAPIHLVIPSHVITGEFRLCSEPSGEACAGLTVTVGAAD